MKAHLAMIGTALSIMGGCAGYRPAADDTPDWSRLGHASVVVVREVEAGRYQLLRDGQAFFVQGAGGTQHLEQLAARGGNAIRTWDSEGIDDLMNEAHRLGLAVQAGIWLEHERHGYDYNDPQVRAEQLAKVRRLVTRYRNHPALLSWGVGNEVELGGSLDTALVAIEEAAALVKELDPNHPTVAIVAEIGDDKATRIAAECPSIDIIGVNSYGGLASVPERLLGQGYDGPYLITEFGPLGHWEGPHTEWGAPIEMTSSEKADFIAANYAAAIEGHRDERCLGSFAFLWGHKQETTESWFGMLLESGETIETVDRLGAFWTGKEPTNRAPRVTALDADGIDLASVTPGVVFGTRVQASDPDGDALSIQWRITAESSDRKEGGDAEAVPAEVPDVVVAQTGTTARLRAPTVPGAYRVFVTVRDGHGHAGTANLAFRVLSEG